MPEELQVLGLNVGYRRVGRLMRENDIRVIRTRKYKATTDSIHKFNIAPNLLDQDFSVDWMNFEKPKISGQCRCCIWRASRRSSLGLRVWRSNRITSERAELLESGQLGANCCSCMQADR
jgi:transposase InsO family protein